MRGCHETQFSCTMMTLSFRFEAPSALKALAETRVKVDLAFQAFHRPLIYAMRSASLVDDAAAKVPRQLQSGAIRCVLLGTGKQEIILFAQAQIPSGNRLHIARLPSMRSFTRNQYIAACRLACLAAHTTMSPTVVSFRIPYHHPYSNPKPKLWFFASTSKRLVQRLALITL